MRTSYEEWEKTVSGEIKGDSLWRVEAYRLGLFIADMSWHDVTKLMQDKRTLGLSNQLYRAVGSISANVAEGYSRGTGKDRARFYEYALGSARESRDWYHKSRHVVGETITRHRLSLLTQVIRLLLTMIPQQRRRTLREQYVSYQTAPGQSEPTVSRETLDTLLQKVPLP
jgi:four helix bundle protein